MIRDEDWERILRRVGARRRNPQLQVLGNPRYNGSERPSAAVLKAIRKFHGSADGDLMAVHRTGEGDERVVETGYLGHVPAISWISEDEGSKPCSVTVEGERVTWHGFRIPFRGKNRPLLILDIPSNEALIVGDKIADLARYADENGVLGYSRVVEYVTEKEESTKGPYHYVHEFEEGAEPVLRFVNGDTTLVYDRDRNQANPESGLDGPRQAVYEVSDWFHEGTRRHEDR